MFGFECLVVGQQLIKGDGAIAVDVNACVELPLNERKKPCRIACIAGVMDVSADGKRTPEMVASVPCKLGKVIEMQFDLIFFRAILRIDSQKVLSDLSLGKFFQPIAVVVSKNQDLLGIDRF